MENLIRRIDLRDAKDEKVELRQEWLVTNGLGGYASGTISGAVSRRYHGLLVAALPTPLGRVVMLNHLAEYLHFPDGRILQIGGDEPQTASGTTAVPHYVSQFRVEDGLPVWTFEADGHVV